MEASIAKFKYNDAGEFDIAALHFAEECGEAVKELSKIARFGFKKSKYKPAMAELRDVELGIQNLRLLLKRMKNEDIRDEENKLD